MNHKQFLEMKLLTTILPPPEYGIFKGMDTTVRLLRLKYQLNNAVPHFSQL